MLVEPIRNVLSSLQASKVQFFSVEDTPLKYFLAGGFGGICAVITGHPLDTIKVRLQAMPGTYKNTLDAARCIISKEGFCSLYKGMLAPLITAAPLSAISICTYHSGKNLIMKPEQSKATNGQLMFAGIFSGICISPITIPAERIKCLLQIQVGGKRKYKGFLDCGVKLLKEGGIPNIFVGTGASLLRDLPATGVYFLTYEWTMEFLLRNATKMTWEPIIAGGLAGIASWAIAMPADVMKSQIQSSPLGTYPKGMRSAFPLILRKEGWFGLFRGTVPVLIRAFPTNAACFYGLEMGLKFLNKHFPWL